MHTLSGTAGVWQSHNGRLETESAAERVSWALETFGERIVLASSFGAQAAVCLHLVTRQRPDIPVVLIDTGYLFPETYQFADQLTERLGLKLHVYRPRLSPAWLEARHGRLWEKGREGLERYNRIVKVEPMRRALDDLQAEAWFSGVRREQARSRRNTGVLELQNGRHKVHPIIDWSEREVEDYLTQHELPRNPRWHQGYASIGDFHTSRPLSDDLTEEESRFFGIKRECGLHQHV